jgi:hypothetical protein
VQQLRQLFLPSPSESRAGGMGLGPAAGNIGSMEGMDRFPDTLVTAVQRCGNLLPGLLLLTCQESLAAAQGD